MGPLYHSEKDQLSPVINCHAGLCWSSWWTNKTKMFTKLIDLADNVS